MDIDHFRKEANKLLKCLGKIKKERNKMIEEAISMGFATDEWLEELVYLKAAKENMPSEASEQKRFVAWFKEKYPHIDIMMIRNDGYRTPFERNEQIAMGLLPGAADLLIPDYWIWIEFKRIDGGAGQSEKQKIFQQRREAAGNTYLLCNGCDEAIKKLENLL
jgi:hypothetical protein